MKRELDTDDLVKQEEANNEELGEKHLRIEESESQEDLLVGEPNVASVIAQQMNITEPLSSLRTSLEDRLGIALTDYEFFLQNEQQLDADKNLVNQCVQGEGMVQINVELIQPIGEKPRINIVDVLKPAEDEIEIPAGAITQAVEGLEDKKMMVVSEDSSNVTRWTVSEEFRDNLIIRRTPQDPEKWTESDVKYWLTWAIKQFGVVGVDMSNFNMTGRKLCELTHDEFRTLVPHDDGDIFWTHLELLRKCKFVAVIQAQPQLYTVNEPKLRQYCKVGQSNKLRLCKTGYHTSSPGNRTGNNGQIQLWQFLLELLTDKDSRECIHWVGDDGEFKLSNPEMVAQLWGLRKNKPNMNYEKLSRALRYYYDGDMISKVHGNRFVYKFVCDLKQLIGYSAAELNRLVMDCEQKKIQRVKSTYSKKDESIIIPGSS